MSTNLLDALAEDGPEWRRWEFDLTGAASYVERIFAEKAADRVLLAEFSFERVRRQ